MTWFAPIPLSIKLPLLAAAMMVLVGTVASQQVLRSLAQVQDARIQELARMHVEGLSVALGPLVLRHDVWEIYDTLDRAAQGGEGRRMVLTAVADERGRVLAATDPRRVPMDSDIAALAGDAVALGDLSVNGASSVLSLLAHETNNPLGGGFQQMKCTKLVDAGRRQFLRGASLPRLVPSPPPS